MQSLTPFVAISLLAVLGCDTFARPRGPISSSEQPQESPSKPETSGGFVTNANRGLPPYPDAPADPWIAVDGDQPRRRPAGDAVWNVRDNDFACTAVHDHCFAPDVWLIENEPTRPKFRIAAAYVFGPKGPMLPVSAKSGGLPSEAYTAYRTVPATKKNLKPGAHVMALTFPTTQLTRGSDVFNAVWNTGIVDRVDWDLGFVFLVDQDRSYWITATRTAVLSWKPGGKVEIVGGGSRDSLAVRADEVISPQP